MASTIAESHQFTYINGLVGKFYEFMGNIYIEHKNLNKITVSTVDTPIDTVTNVIDLSIIANPETIDITTLATTPETPVVTGEVTEAIKETKPVQSFTDYFLFKLYYNYGVKRRMVNDHIALLYYAKNAKGYKSTDPITMLCRHMLLDTRFMRIISLGIPKAVKLDEFCKTYDIDKTNVDTNENSDGIAKFRVYKFPEGTMMTYNPSLGKYNITTIMKEDDEDDEEEATKAPSTTMNDTINKNIEIQFNQQFMYSTRKVVGTGHFGSYKSFYEMFAENNDIAKTNLANIPESVIADKVLVFNIEHPENSVISPKSRNVNTLCAVYRFKDELLSQCQYEAITSIEYVDELETPVLDKFKELGKDMIIQIQVANFKKHVQSYGVNLQLPEIIKKFEKRVKHENDDTSAVVEYKYDILDKMSIEQLEKVVLEKPKEFQGYIIYGLNGDRTKINNPTYKELKDLKGNKPITVDQSNTKNLFNLYWRLVKDKKIERFLSEFDIVKNMNAPGYMIYERLFRWFFTIVRNYGFNLSTMYHNTFVKRITPKHEIPFSMKPLCGDLHKQYLETKTPMTHGMVLEYLFRQPENKIFWRLFMQNNEMSAPKL